MVVKAKSSKGGSEMRKSLFAKLGIFGLAAIFLLSMASISADQMKTQGKPVKPPKPDDAAELYRVSISINGGGPGFATAGCAGPGYFYATENTGRDLFGLDTDGILTPGPGGETAPLTMSITSGLDGTQFYPIFLEGCVWYDGCHGNLDGFSPGYEGLFIKFLKSQDGTGPNQDIQIRWMFDYVPGAKKHGIGWHLYSLLGDYSDDPELETVVSTNPFPSEGLAPGETFETDVIGSFWLLHEGISCDENDPTYRILLHDFDIHLFIERVNLQ